MLDASLTIAALLQERHTGAAQQVMREVSQSGAVVPSLWRLEVANVLRVSVLRGRCDEAFVDRSLERLTALPIVIDADTDRCAWNATLVLARECDLTLYDAAYLELALRLGAPLGTIDDELIAAAKTKNIRTLVL
ncbi:MAG TPA: type II toxin-antitoxin system VapC family toxin [Rhizomicrobium sp.]